jgi:hypothetical protein
MTGIEVELSTVLSGTFLAGSGIPWILKRISILNHLTIKKVCAVAAISISMMGFMTVGDLVMVEYTEQPFITQTCIAPQITGPILTCKNNQYILSTSSTLFGRPASLPNKTVIYQGPFSKMVYFENPL